MITIDTTTKITPTSNHWYGPQQSKVRTVTFAGFVA